MQTGEQADLNKTTKNKIKKASNINLRRRNFKESKELDFLSKEIPKLEKQKRYIEKDLNEGKGNIITLSQSLAKLIEKIETSEERWLELSDMSP